MPTEPEPVTLAQVVHRAAEVVDPEGADPDVVDLLVRFEDADEPVSSVEDVEQRLAEGAGAIDPQEESGPVQVARAVATYLAFRRDEVTDKDTDEIVRLAVRAEYDGHPPEPVTEWLALNGVDV
jgi:sirohydrochlorin ferrochelatase